MLDKGFTHSTFPDNSKLNELKEEYLKNVDDWSVVHETFTMPLFGVLAQQGLESQGFTCQEVLKWIQFLEPNLSSMNNFDFELLLYLKGKGYNPSQDLSSEKLKELKKEFDTWSKKENKPAQEYLDVIYSEEQRGNIKELDLTGKDLVGSLDLTGFYNLKEINVSGNPRLEKLDVQSSKKLRKVKVSETNLNDLSLGHLVELEELVVCCNKLASLNVSGCPNLKKILCYGNPLIDLDLSKNEELRVLNISNNNFIKKDLSFLSHLVNLRVLFVENSDKTNGWSSNDLYWPVNYMDGHGKQIKQGIYNRFFGSLEPLKNLTKLEKLYISNTDIDSGLEYLPESVKIFYCSAAWKKDAKCKAIYNLFANDQGIVEIERDERITNFAKKLQWIKLNFTSEEIWKWITAGAKLDDYEFVAWFRDTKKNLVQNESLTTKKTTKPSVKDLKCMGYVPNVINQILEKNDANHAINPA